MIPETHEIELSACPFCGNTEKLGVRRKTGKWIYNMAETDRISWDRFSVRCPKCRARGPVVSGFVSAEPRPFKYNGQTLRTQTRADYTVLAMLAWNAIPGEEEQE